MLTEKTNNSIIKVLGLRDEEDGADYVFRLSALTRQYRKVTRIEDSLSDDEVAAMTTLTQGIESHKLINENSTVVIWGCWYGSILVPYFSDRAKRVVGIDKDDDVIRFAKNKLFPDNENVELITDDVFSTHRDIYLDTDLIVNTACDHMPPMKDWTWFKHGAVATDPDFPKGAADKDPTKKRVFKSPKLSSNCHFAFQSSDRVGLAGRTNCVKSLDEFKDQLPSRAEVWFENALDTEEGKVFTLLGKMK